MREIQVKKKQSFYHQKSEVKQFYVVPINDDEFSLTPSALNVGCMYFVTYIPTDVTGQRVGVSGPKLESNAMLLGALGVPNTAIP